MNEYLLTQVLHPEHPSRGGGCWRSAAPCGQVEVGTRPVQIFAFERFSLVKDGAPLVFFRKAPKKPITLLKALLALGGRDVSGRHLTDALWPDDEGDAAYDVLAVNVHRLRKLLGSHEAVVMHDGRVSLDPHYCWVDVWAFQRLLGEGGGVSEADRADLLVRALSLYRGAFLVCEWDEPWSLSMRERLRSTFIRHSAELGRLKEDAGQWEQAIECYQRALETDELAEELYQGLMRCYAHLGRRAEGVSVYRLHRTLSAILGIAASPATEELLREFLP